MPGAWSRLAPCALTLLLLSVAAGSAWLASLPEPAPEAPLSSQVMDLPVFAATDHLLVVDVGSSGFRERLTVAGLQGLVNRDLSRVYLDREGEVADLEQTGGTGLRRGNLLSFLLLRYNLTYEAVSPTGFLADFSGHATGLVVYDPDRPQTVNVARTLAGLEDLLLVAPDQLADITDLTGLRVTHDLREAPWQGLSDLDLLELAFDRYYVKGDRNPLLGCDPREEPMSDYGVATRAFWFYLNPGPFTLPGEMALYEKFMRGSAPGVPLLGWFDQPTGVEENRGVQIASRYGHFVIGGYRLPNISLLTAYGRDDLTRPPATYSAPSIEQYVTNEFSYNRHGFPEQWIENKTYVSFAVTDGDNLEFFTRRGRDIWNQRQRGSLPLAWSVSPALAELAPPLLERTYLEATENDTFIAGPSGLGYFYPGFLPEGHLEPILGRTGDLMAKAYLDEIWLLNSFTTFETPYSDEDLDTYEEVLDPHGIVLDYGDVPLTWPYWMSADHLINPGDNPTQFIRAHHLWGSVNNLEAKLDLTLSENDPQTTKRPHFVVIALMSIDFDLDEIMEVYSRLPKEVEVVSLPTMFTLMEAHWSQRMYSEMQNGSALLQSDYFAEVSGALEVIPHHSGHYYHSVVISNDITEVFIISSSTLLILAIIETIIWNKARKRRVKEGQDRATSNHSGRFPWLDMIFWISLWFIGLKSIDKALHFNFWYYPWLVFGFMVALLFPRVVDRFTFLKDSIKEWKGLITGSTLLAGIGIFTLHPVGILLILPATINAAQLQWSRNRIGPLGLTLSFAASLVVLNIISYISMITSIIFASPLVHESWQISQQIPYGFSWVAGFIVALGLLLQLSRTDTDDLKSPRPRRIPAFQNLIGASALTLASLPWYLTRSYFWTNHLKLHLYWLASMAPVIPLLAAIGLMLIAVKRGPNGQNQNGKIRRKLSNLLGMLRTISSLPASLLFLLLGIVAYMIAALVDGRLRIAYLLIAAEACWLGAAYLALEPNASEPSTSHAEAPASDIGDTGSTSNTEAPSSSTPDNRSKPSTSHSSPPAPNETNVGSTSTFGNLLLYTLGLQAFLALYLTIPPVFYAVFVWRGAPVWFNYLLYHFPLMLAVVGLLGLVAVLVRQAVLKRVSATLQA